MGIDPGYAGSSLKKPVVPLSSPLASLLTMRDSKGTGTGHAVKMFDLALGECAGLLKRHILRSSKETHVTLGTTLQSECGCD